MFQEKGRDITNGVEQMPIYSEVDPVEVFQYVKTNVPGPGCDEDMFKEQYAGCTCKDQCVPTSCQCLSYFGEAYDNGVLIKKEFSLDGNSRPVLECGSSCLCDRETCKTRLVQKGVKTNLAVFKTENRGFGLKVSSKGQRLPLFSFVCEYAGEVVSDGEAKKRLQFCEASGQCNYLIGLKERVANSINVFFIDPHRIGNIGRFINHSCDPNLFMIPVRVNHPIPRLALFALRNIEPGEELTFDYGGNTCVVQPSAVGSSTCTDKDLNAEENKMSSISALPHIMEEKDQSYNTVDQESLIPPSKKVKIFNDPSNCLKKREKSAEFNSLVQSSTCSSSCHLQYCDSVTDSYSHSLVLKKSTSWNSDINKSPVVTNNMSEVGENEQVTRKTCFCGSSNCKGFLPFEFDLFS